MDYAKRLSRKVEKSLLQNPGLVRSATCICFHLQVKVFTQPNYTENFVQCILDANGAALAGSTLVVGGDGRYYCKEAAELIVRISAANDVAKLLVGQNGILSTPAVSSLIRHNKALGKVS